VNAFRLFLRRAETAPSFPDKSYVVLTPRLPSKAMRHHLYDDGGATYLGFDP
jgi:hypothetical protein